MSRSNRSSPVAGGDSGSETMPGGFVPRINWGVLGTAAPVFPGFEVDVCERVPDQERQDAVWHRERARGLLRAHPEIKNLMGPNPWTALFCVFCSGAQIALAMGSVHLPWWGMLLLAWCVGALLNQTLFQLAHECDHQLVFRKSSWNRWLFTATSLPMFLSGHHTWWLEHLVHHRDQGAIKDFITRRRSFFLLTRFTPPLFFPYSLLMLVAQVIRSALGLILYVATSLFRGRLDPTDFTLSVLADKHLPSGYRRKRIAGWAVIYPLLSFMLCGGLMAYGFWIGGWPGLAMPILYLLLAQTFFTGWLHPYCLGWVLGISHFHGSKHYQPSMSNYGRLINLYTFNAGLHVEHHDLATIPWNRLHKLRKLAPEFYEELESIRSYTWLALHFVFGNRTTYEENFNHEAHRNLSRMTRLDTASPPR